MCAYQGVGNVIFSEDFASVLNEWSLTEKLKHWYSQRKKSVRKVITQNPGVIFQSSVESLKVFLSVWVFLQNNYVAVW